MLTREHYELLAKYTSNDDVPFSALELDTIYSILNIRRGAGNFDEGSIHSYLIDIKAAVEEQNIVITELCGEFMQISSNSSSDIKAYQYIISKIDEIISPFILDNVIGVLAETKFLDMRRRLDLRDNEAQ